MDIKRSIFRTESEARFMASRLPSAGYEVVACAPLAVSKSGFWYVDSASKKFAKHDDRETCDSCGCKSYRISDGLCGDCWNESL